MLEKPQTYSYSTIRRVLLVKGSDSWGSQSEPDAYASGLSFRIQHHFLKKSPRRWDRVSIYEMSSRDPTPLAGERGSGLGGQIQRGGMIKTSARAGVFKLQPSQDFKTILNTGRPTPSGGPDGVDGPGKRAVASKIRPTCHRGAKR